MKTASNMKENVELYLMLSEVPGLEQEWVKILPFSFTLHPLSHKGGSPFH
jgi:hypothetical protein